MKAAIRRTYGSPNTIKIEDIDTPTPKEEEILVKVHATTVNRTDCANLTGKPFIMHFVLGLFKPRKAIIGTDFAGEIVQVGKNVKNFKVTDRVFGFNDQVLESQAEYIALKPEGNVLTIPKNIDYKKAAASVEGAHYAYSFIKKVNIQSGQNILINGATGGIGSALLQFVKQYDVHITATCNTKNIERIKSLGADKIYDYTTEDFTTSNEKYDFIFDAVGKSTFGKCKPLLKENGIYISSELGPYSQNIFYALFNKQVIFPIPYKPEETLPYIKNLLEKEVFKPVIDSEYPLEDIDDAYTYVMKGIKTGNVIINI